MPTLHVLYAIHRSIYRKNRTNIQYLVNQYRYRGSDVGIPCTERYRIGLLTIEYRKFSMVQCLHLRKLVQSLLAIFYGHGD